MGTNEYLVQMPFTILLHRTIKFHHLLSLICRRGFLEKPVHWESVKKIRNSFFGNSGKLSSIVIAIFAAKFVPANLLSGTLRFEMLHLEPAILDWKTSRLLDDWLLAQHNVAYPTLEPSKGKERLTREYPTISSMVSRSAWFPISPLVIDVHPL